jgi:hypothetical protein
LRETFSRGRTLGNRECIGRVLARAGLAKEQSRAMPDVELGLAA